MLTWHNETLNIYTHLIPGLYWLWKTMTVIPSGSPEHEFLIFVANGAAATMGITSGLAHLLHIEKGWATFSWKMDYLGIIAINYAHSLLDTFLLTKGIWHSRWLCIVGFFLQTMGALFCAQRIVSDLEIGRFWAFAYPALTVPFTVAVYCVRGSDTVFPVVQDSTQASLNCSILITIAGVVFFKGGFPERYYNPRGIFDKFGSHTWHHIFIVCSIVAGFKCLPNLYLLE